MSPRWKQESRMLAKFEQRHVSRIADGSCRQMVNTTMTSLWNSNKSDTCGLPYLHCPHSRMMTIQWGQQLSSILEDDINDEDASSAAAMRRVSSDRQTQSEIGLQCHCRLCSGRSKTLECDLHLEGGCEKSSAVMTARHEKDQACEGQRHCRGRIHNTQHGSGHRHQENTEPVALRKALLVVDGMLECQAGSHRQDLNEREPRCREHLGKVSYEAWFRPHSPMEVVTDQRSQFKGVFEQQGREDECFSEAPWEPDQPSGTMPAARSSASWSEKP